MKTILLISLLLVNAAAFAQIRRDTVTQAQPPVNNPYQLPNYYENNSIYNNNSMQNNKPADPHAGPYTGNADYADPTRNIPNPTYQYNIPNNAPSGTVNGSKVNK